MSQSPTSAAASKLADQLQTTSLHPKKTKKTKVTETPEEEEFQYSQFCDDEAEEVTEQEAEAEEKAAHADPPALEHAMQDEPAESKFITKAQYDLLLQQYSQREAMLQAAQYQLELESQTIAARDQQVEQLHQQLAGAPQYISEDVDQQNHNIYVDIRNLLNNVFDSVTALYQEIRNLSSPEQYGEKETQEGFWEEYKDHTVHTHVGQTSMKFSKLRKNLLNLPVLIDQYSQNLDEVAQRNHFDRVMVEKMENRALIQPEVQQTRQTIAQSTRQHRSLRNEIRSGRKRQAHDL